MKSLLIGIGVTSIGLAIKLINIASSYELDDLDECKAIDLHADNVPDVYGYVSGRIYTPTPFVCIKSPESLYQLWCKRVERYVKTTIYYYMDFTTIKVVHESKPPNGNNIELCNNLAIEHIDKTKSYRININNNMYDNIELIEIDNNVIHEVNHIDSTITTGMENNSYVTMIGIINKINNIVTINSSPYKYSSISGDTFEKIKEKTYKNYLYGKIIGDGLFISGILIIVSNLIYNIRS